MIQVYIIIGSVFAVMFLLQLWLNNILSKRRLKEMEERMTKNMIKAIEKIEWGENNG